MADIAKADLRNRVLMHLGVLAAGEAPADDDATLVEEAIDAAHSRLRKFGLVPFATSAVPDWAQIALRNIVAADVATTFGKTGQQLMEFKQAAAAGGLDLARQVAGYRHNVPIKGVYF
jgi:hypothetical protein